MGDGFEALLYLFGFWLFVFSRRFRNLYIENFKKMGVFRKGMEVVGASVAAVVGLGLPMLVIYGVVLYALPSGVDTCLDLGGSFDYQECKCDYNRSHVYTGSHHQCN